MRKDRDGSVRAEVRDFGGDVLADFEARGGGGGGSVADVKGVFAGGDVEIVDEFSVFTECLGANAGGARDEILGLNFWDQALERADEGGFGKGSMDLLVTFVPMLAGEGPKGRVSERF